MAVCTLDLSHPCFTEKYGRLQEDPDLEEALQELKKKVESEHTSCNRVVQRFYGNKKHSELNGKIWKYDWGKTSASGRKSWRLVVIAPEPKVQPYRLIAGAIYAKNVAEQLSLQELSAIFTCVTKNEAPLSIAASAAVGEFHRVPNGDGRLRSICMRCYSSTPVSISEDVSVLAKDEAAHRCDLEPERKA